MRCSSKKQDLSSVSMTKRFGRPCAATVSYLLSFERYWAFLLPSGLNSHKPNEKSTSHKMSPASWIRVAAGKRPTFQHPFLSCRVSESKALVSVAVDYITRGAPPGAADVVHRLNKIDSAEGLVSLRHAANQHVPYAVLLYERYLGRPFASHRDSVSELVGDVMESAIEERLAKARITFRKTRRAERVPGFEQAPDFFIPTEVAPAAIIEAKITGDDGTARDKVSRVLNLATMRDKRERDGHPTFELIACIDGRGFRVRREDMRKMLLATRGKVFTLATLDRLIDNSRLCEFLPRPS